MMMLHSSIFGPPPSSSVLHTSLLYPPANSSVLHTSLLRPPPSSSVLHSSQLLCPPPNSSVLHSSLTHAPSRLSFFPPLQVARRSQREQPVIKPRPYKEPRETGDRRLVLALTSYDEGLERAGAVVWQFSRSNMGSSFYCGISMAGALEKPAPVANEGKKRGKKEAGKEEAGMEKAKLQVLNDLITLGIVLGFVRRRLQFSSLRIIGPSSEVASLLSVKEMVEEKKNESRKNEKNGKPVEKKSVKETVGKKKNQRRKNKKNRKPVEKVDDKSVEKEDDKFQKTIKELAHKLKSEKYQLGHDCYGGAGYFKRSHFSGIQKYNNWVRRQEEMKEEAGKGRGQEAMKEEAGKGPIFIKELTPTGIEILLWPSSAVSPATKCKVVEDWKVVVASGVLKA